MDPEPSHYNFISITKYLAMTTEVLQLANGTVPGIIVVYDLKQMTLSHFIRIPMSLMTKYTHYAQVYHNIYNNISDKKKDICVYC